VIVGIAFLLAVPAAGWAMHSWLQDFASRAPVEPWVFFLAGGLMGLIVLVTISSRAIAAALANPIEAVRGE